MPDIPTSPGFDEIVVGFEDETENITAQLIKGTDELYVVPITGMAGLGKTTLARKVYCHRSVINWFGDFRAWCCVSQEYDKNRVFREIFSQVVDSKSEDDTDEVLLEILMKKCKDEQSWVDTAEALRVAVLGKCKGHKIIRDDATEVLHDSSWKKMCSTLRKSIMEKCKNSKNWGDIAKPLNYVRNDASEMSAVERREEIKMWEEIESLISQSKIVDKKDIKRTDFEVEKLFKSLLDLAEVFFKHIKEKWEENDSRNEMLEILFKSLDDIVEPLYSTQVLYESLIKMSEDDNSWKRISSALRESIMEKCQFTKKWDDIAKPLYESLILDFKDNNVIDNGTELSPKFPKEMRKDIRMWEEMASAIRQSKILDRNDIMRAGGEAQKLFESLLDLAEVLFKNRNGKCQEIDSWNHMLQTLFKNTNEKFQENERWKILLQTLFKNLNDMVETLLLSLNKNCHNSWDDNIAEKLRKRLLGQRYLIVLDDVWSTKAWDELSSAFDPSNTQGSRIILTSRGYNVGKYARSGEEPHCLRFFTTEESQELLQLRLSKENVSPPELKEFGRKIAEKCGGVPLVIVLVAGILQKKIEEKYFSWKEFLKSLSSHIRQDESRSMDVIALSYNYLPQHLKPCLLYFGAFPEDYEIPVSKLIQLWMAEGFVNQIEMKRLEDEAEDYLDHLIGSNLIMVSTRGYNGSVRTCRVHDMIGSFCMKKAEEDKFLVQTDSEHTGWFSACNRFSLHKRNDCDLSPNSAMSRNPSLGTLLCFSSHNPNIGTFSLFTSHVDPSSGSWLPITFKHVRVLDLESIVVGELFFYEVKSLVFLRYLAVCLNGSGLVSPLSLKHLRHLETFKVKSSAYLHLPFILWDLESLRHLHIDHYCHHCLYSRSFISIPTKPLNLQTLSIPVLLNSHTEERLLRKLPHLRKLRCRFSTLWYRKCHRFPELGFLEKLESLEACHTNEHLNAPIPSAFNFPQSLKQLALHKFRLPWDSISEIARLPQLESLELFSAFDGEQWDVEEQTFLKLKFLRISESRIVRWNSSDDSFPILERLILAKCRRLEGVPSDFQAINTLQVIEVDQCNTSVARSVVQIQEEMEALGNENLIVHVRDSDLALGELVDWIRGDNMSHGPLQNVIEKGREWMRKHWDITIKHVYREQNRVANFLANMAAQQGNKWVVLDEPLWDWKLDG